MSTHAATSDQLAGAEPAAAAPRPAEPVPGEDRLLHHEYDGIQEYDNPLPFWWSGIFVLCIAHAAFYVYWYHGGGGGKSPQQEYAADLAAWQKLRAAQPKEELAVDEDTLASMAQDVDTVQRGAGVFAKNCTSCHMPDGRGQIGPNLTDLYQIHGSKRMDLYQTIYDGVPDKGMLTWGGVLDPDDLAAVAVYVSTLRGKNIPGKAPDGHPVEPFH
ncbi:MAG TPA: cbb3-type cytochrome c oxidase N-terminal domain-containing protein [Kofleriaceae bacterium]|nr:cbb3-type cytochrome c oxidase N-terminal domain-containing protein [Kofleriaceae bacterium]